MAAPQRSLAQDLFEDMGRKVAEASKSSFEEDDENSKLVEEIESLCMNCHEQGTTRLLLTRIPFFREIVIMSFSCPHCGFQNSEVQPAGTIQERGTKFTLKVESADDLNRQIIKSDTCTFRIEDIDLEIPPGRGQLTNVEGILTMIATDLQSKQDERKEKIPEVWAQLETVIKTVQDMASGAKLPFTTTLDDPAGNSWIQFSANDSTTKYFRHEYPRSPAQNEALGLGDGSATETAETGPSGEAPGTQTRPEYHASHMYPAMPAEQNVNNVDDDEDIVENQVYSFPAQCPGCTKPCATNMKMVRIPHFKEVIIMSTVCDHCGYRNNEVKTGGEVPELGRRITLRVERPEDLSRDILKSETCGLYCPEIKLSVEPGTLGGRFTTVEGLLRQIRDDLHNNIFSDDDAGGGDSMNADERERWNSFFSDVDSAIEGKEKFTLVLEDPFAASYVQSYADEGADEQLTVEDYERTEQEEEELGLKDIKTDHYEENKKDAGETKEESGER
ncbi:zf-ZPR1-domain-containing protein [Rhizodiscina lignyota]|uniref:Zf-ZPR1-domain-containing protein n=1 Tax=Rhizodiscina lignyota TaxID=1504668 RepID=A0A9P4I8C3_9PEZI|nr:zf-ZPR1-domain-containing protein [Rhizodiscina lignyota]